MLRFTLQMSSIIESKLDVLIGPDDSSELFGVVADISSLSVLGKGDKVERRRGSITDSTREVTEEKLERLFFENCLNAASIVGSLLEMKQDFEVEGIEGSQLIDRGTEEGLGMEFRDL